MSSLCVGLAETINKLGPAFLENRKCNTLYSPIELLTRHYRCGCLREHRRPSPRAEGDLPAGP